jgi:hypothetical protein
MTNQQKAMLQTLKGVGMILIGTLVLFGYNYLVTPEIFGITIALAIAGYCIWMVYTINLSKIEREEKYENRPLR